MSAAAEYFYPRTPPEKKKHIEVLIVRFRKLEKEINLFLICDLSRIRESELYTRRFYQIYPFANFLFKDSRSNILHLNLIQRFKNYN